jgi:hypothetical protein
MQGTGDSPHLLEQRDRIGEVLIPIHLQRLVELVYVRHNLAVAEWHLGHADHLRVGTAGQNMAGSSKWDTSTASRAAHRKRSTVQR